MCYSGRLVLKNPPSSLVLGNLVSVSKVAPYLLPITARHGNNTLWLCCVQDCLLAVDRSAECDPAE